YVSVCVFFFQAEDGIRDFHVTGVQTCALPISSEQPVADVAAGQADPGRWRGGWSPETQAQWLEAMGAIAMAKPYVHSVCWQELRSEERRVGKECRARWWAEQ